MKVFWLFLLSTSAFALPVNNPIDSTRLCHKQILDITENCGLMAPIFNHTSFRMGLCGDYVYNRHVQGDSLGLQKDIDTFQVNTTAAFMAFDFFEWFTLFGRVGATTLALEADSFALGRIGFGGSDHQRVFIDLGSNFSWAIGCEALLWQWRSFSLGAAGQYFSTNQQLQSVQFEQNKALQNTNPNHYMDYREWQVDLSASYEVNPMFIPYVAFTWSSLKTKGNNFAMIFIGENLTNNIFLIDFKNSKQWGYAVGTSLLLYDSINVTIEGRFADEKALYVNGMIRF